MTILAVRCRLLSVVPSPATVLLLAVALSFRFYFGVDAFFPLVSPSRQPSIIFSTTPTARDVIPLNKNTKTMSEPPCFWKPSWQKGKRWLRRIHLEDLEVGQKLEGTVVQELLYGKTGPKLFFEVGVGRTNSKGKWSIVNAMLRLDRAKESVTKKRAARLRKKEFVDLWVSRVQAECGRLEVCLNEEDVEKYQKQPKTTVSLLRAGMEVTGRIVRILPYGVMVDVGANRLGLLHILKVRELYGRYIDKEKGLVEAGLERGTKVRLCVKAIEKRRLELDFTEDVKSDAEAELGANKSQKSAPLSEPEGSTAERADTSMSAEELSEWAAFAESAINPQGIPPHAEEEQSGKSQDLEEEEDPKDDDYDEDEGDYDDYDEQRDIEDSLGLGYY